VEFTMDLGGTDPAIPDETWNPDDPGDGGLTDDGERLTYKLADLDGDGRGELIRTDENNGDPDAPIDLPIITNLDALNFVYLDEDRSPLPFVGGLVPNGDLDDIRLVQVCLLVRTTNEDLRYSNTEPYENINPDGAETIFTGPGDHFRRRVICKDIKIRNAGL
jgi:hypothetical protein